MKHRPGFDWQMVEAPGNAEIYYLPGSPAERRLEKLRDDVVKSKNRVATLLGEPARDMRLHIFTVQSRQQMKEFIGDEINGAAICSQRVLVFVVTDTWTASGPHEYLHVFAWHAWGKGADWINEGLAVYADDMWHRCGLHQLARYIQLRGRLIPLAQLADGFRRHHDMISYPEAGSFVKFIYETYGRDAVKQAYRGGEKGLARATGKSLPELEQEWHRMLEGIEPGRLRYRLPPEGPPEKTEPRQRA